MSKIINRPCHVIIVAALCSALTLPALAANGRPPSNFPRIMGMQTAAKNYHDLAYQRELAKLDIVVLGFYPGWNPARQARPIGETVQALKRLNPSILVGQYTVLSEVPVPLVGANADQNKVDKASAEAWWLVDAAGKKVQWTAQYAAWDVNVTAWAKPDANALRWSDWLADRDYRMYFEKNPELDIWYFDNALSMPAVRIADWTLDHRNDDGRDATIAAAHRRGHAAHWRRALQRRHTALLMGNADDLSSVEYRSMLHGAYLEALIGKSWSMETWAGWPRMMERYRAAMKYTAAPHLVGFNVSGGPSDYRLLRYGLTSCLLDDGYFSYTDSTRGFSTVRWFDEYDVDLGVPAEAPPTAAWKNGVYKRAFSNGMVLVNPGGSAVNVTLEGRYRKIAGRQDPVINDGTTVDNVWLPAKDGLVLLRVN